MVKCKPGDPLCLQVGNDLGVELMIEGIRESAKMLKDEDYIFNPVGMDDGDGPLFVHPDDKKKNAANNRKSRQNNLCVQKCQKNKFKTRLSDCKKNCNQNQTSKRDSRTVSGGAPATGKPGAGKGCDEKCGQLNGWGGHAGRARQACIRRKARLQCNKDKKGKKGNGGKGRMGPGNRGKGTKKNPKWRG